MRSWGWSAPCSGTTPPIGLPAKFVATSDEKTFTGGAATVGSVTSMATTPDARAAMKIHCLPPKASDEIAPELLADRPVAAGVTVLVEIPNRIETTCGA